MNKIIPDSKRQIFLNTNIWPKLRDLFICSFVTSLPALIKACNWFNLLTSSGLQSVLAKWAYKCMLCTIKRCFLMNENITYDKKRKLIKHFFSRSSDENSVVFSDPLTKISLFRFHLTKNRIFQRFFDEIYVVSPLRLNFS